MSKCFDVAILYTDGSSIPSPAGTGFGIYGYFFNKADFKEPAYKLPGITEQITPEGFTKGGVAELPMLPDDALTFIEGIGPIPHSNAQIAELLAFVACIHQDGVKDSIPFTAKQYIIYSDSAYLINTYTQWIDGWAKRSWVKGDGTPCANIEILERIHEIKRSKLPVEFRKIPAHKGHHGNEMADTLAKRGSGMSAVAEGNYQIVWNLPELVVEDDDDVSGMSLIDADSLGGPNFFDSTDINVSRYCYIHAGEEHPTMKLKGDIWYYMLSGNHAKDKDDIVLVGKLIPDAMFSVTIHRRPVECFHTIAQEHETRAWEGMPALKRFHPICLVNTEMIRRKKFQAACKNGLPVGGMTMSEDKNAWMYDDLIISRLLRPALLSYRTLTIRDELADFARRAVEGHKSVVLNDITDQLFPEGKPSKVFYRNVDRSFKMHVEFPKGKCKIPVVLAKGIDMPDRTAINRIKEPSGKFYIATIRPEDRLVRYALVYIGEEYHGLWCGYYSASRILTEEEAN